MARFHPPDPPAEAERYGPTYTRGNSFRARAEARQRRYRADTLGVGWSEHGHWLDDTATAGGANFVTPEAHRAARARAAAGKGVAERTFRNMLSSQAMAFNVFAPLAADPLLAGRVLAGVVPGLRSVQAIHFEYTPPADVFRDQSGRGGVDCDLLVEATFEDGQAAVLVVETKFVEEEFSACGFRRPGRAGKGQRVCPADVPVAASRAACAYVSPKGYGYWERSDAHRTLAPLPPAGCPFGGPLWQLWVNHTLAHEEAARRGASHARYLVCAPSQNEALLRGGDVVASFRALLAHPETALLVDLDTLLDGIAARAPELAGGPSAAAWVEGIRERYGRI